MGSGYATDVERFLGEIVGYGKLNFVISNGQLDRIMKTNIPPDEKKSLILAELVDTFFGTMPADVGPDGDPSYTDSIEIPRIVFLEDVKKGNTGSSDATFTGETDYDPLKENVGGTKTGDSSAHRRALSDNGILIKRNGRRIVGIARGANFTLGSFDHMFTSNDFYVERAVDQRRGEAVKDYLQRVMNAAGFDERSYVIAHQKDTDPDFPSGHDERVVLNGEGYSVVVRPEGEVYDPGNYSGKERNRLSGAAIYLAIADRKVIKLNKIADAFHSITRAKRGGLRD